MSKRKLLYGRFTIIEELGSGATGTVYRAQDTVTEREVALKTLRPEVAARVGLPRFRRQFYLMAQLSHPRLVPMLEMDIADSTLWFTMSLLDGTLLSELETPIPPEHAIEILMQIAEGLEFIHSHGILHLDLSPRNVFLSNNGVRLMDFGIAHSGRGICGTPAYIAPEVVTGQHADGRTDLYSLGVIALELLTGDNPFAADNARESVERQIKLSPEIPQLGKRFNALSKLLQRLLSKEPSERPPGAYSVKIALQDLLGVERTPRDKFFLSEGPFVGRENELKTILDAWQSLTKPRAFSIHGEPGIGATTLCRQTARRIECEGGKVASVSGEMNPIAEMLTSYLSDEFRPILRAHLPGLGVQLAVEVLSDLNIEPSSPPESRDEFLARAANLFEALTREVPLLIHIAAGHENPLWNALLASTSKILLLFDGGGSGEVIELSDLPRESVEDYIHGIFGEVAASEKLLEQILSRAEGHPGRIRDTLRDFTTYGALEPGKERWEFHPELVPTESPLVERWERLTDAARLLASAIALAESLPADLAESIIEGEYFIISYQLLSSGFITESDSGPSLTYAPSPELARGIDNLLTSKQKQDIHRRLAEAYLAVEPSPDKLLAGAHHLELAGEPKTAYGAYFEAGTGFMKGRRYESAETALASAVRLLDYSPDTESSIVSLKRLALSRKYLGDFDGAREAYYRAMAAAELSDKNAQIANILGDIGITYFESGDVERAIELYERACSAHREMGDETGELRDLVNLAGAYQVEHDYENARKVYKSASEIAEKLDHDLARCAIELNLGELDLAEGGLAEALPKILKAAAIARDNDYGQFLFEALLALSELHRRQGKPVLAEKALSEAEDIATSLGRRALAKAAIERAAQSRTRGRLTDAASAIAEARAMERHLGKEETSNLIVEMALLAAVTGDAPKIGLKIPNIPTAMIAEKLLNALKKTELGDKEKAEAWFGTVIENANEFALEELAAEAAIALAQIKSDDAALRALEDGESAVISGNPYPLARIAAARAMIFAEAGDVAAARHALATAETAFTELDNESALKKLRKLRDELEVPLSASPGLERLLPIIKALNSTLDTRELLSSIVDAALEATSAERGLLFLMERGGPELAIARTADGKDVPTEQVRYSQFLVEDVLRTLQPRLSENIAEDDALSSRESVIDLELSMALCVPILGREGKPRGLIYADSRIGRGDFTNETLELLSALADQAAVALRNAERFDAIRAERDRMADELAGRFGGNSIIGESPQMEQLRERLAAIAEQDVSVLITGETGTGKDLIARTIHSEGTRKDAPFVAVNCAALPETLLESELFGYERGAFTGAAKRHIGKFEQAHGGTIFLDEIAEMPVQLQAKLLRVIENRRFMRLGGDSEIEVDIRLITATNREPEKALEDGHLREDLYYRIAAVRVHLPPLRERRADIAPLVAHFIAAAAEKFDRDVDSISQKALRVLERYRWPGNVRELASTIEETVLFAPGRMLRLQDFPDRITKVSIDKLLADGLPANYNDLKENKRELGEAYEARVIRRLLDEHEWKIADAARQFGMDRTRLHQLMNKYDIERPF